MEEGQGAHPFTLTFSPPTLGREQRSQGVQGGEMSVFQGHVGERPQAFSRLQLWRVRGQEDQMEALRTGQQRGGLPPRPVQNQHDLPALPRASITGKAVKHRLKSERLHARHQPILAFPRLRTDKCVHLQPGVAVFHRSCWGFASLSPHLPDNGLQS